MKIMVMVSIITTIAAPASVSAVAGAYGDGTYGTCTYNTCGITVSTNSTVNLNVIPGTTTTCTTQSDSVAVTTDSTTGYTLSLSNAAATSSLLGGGANAIVATNGTRTNPLALVANTWGYRVDGVGGFGSGPTTAATNVATSATGYAAIPTSAQAADTIATTAVAANPAVATSVWYSLCVNSSLPTDTYASTVIYTAVVN